MTLCMVSGTTLWMDRRIYGTLPSSIRVPADESRDILEFVEHRLEKRWCPGIRA